MKILKSIKGCNSIKILHKMMGNNPKPDHINVDSHIKFGQILSRNETLTSIKGCNSGLQS